MIHETHVLSAYTQLLFDENLILNFMININFRFIILININLILINIFIKFFINNIPISVPIMYIPHVPNSLKVAYRVPEPVPRTETNCEPCDYGLVHFLRSQFSCHVTCSLSKKCVQILRNRPLRKSVSKKL